MRQRLVRLLSKAAVATLVSVTLGLSGLAALPARSALATTPPGFGPQDLQQAYGVGDTTGAGETVALVTPYDDPTAESDLAAYRSQYNLSACTTANGCFRKVNQTGGTTYPQPVGSWATVTAEALDAIAGLCPGCHLLVVEANDTGIPDIGQGENEAVALGAKFIANDIAFNEIEAGQQGELTYDGSYFDHPGVAITAPSGDSGYTVNGVDAGVNYPADSPYVTAVGGTELTDANGAYTQTAWPDSVSGCSEFEPKPSWQADTGCSGRTLNDVSAVADNVAYYNNGSWNTGGGTEVSAAIVAAYYALLASSGVSLGSNPAQYLYTHASTVTDITSGSNGTCSVTYLCTAGTGYDGPTGLGSVAPSPIVSVNTATPVVNDPIYGTLEVYGITSTGVLEADAYSASSGWSGWSSRGAPSGVTLTGTPSAAYNTATGNLEVYATGANGHLEETFYAPGSGWQAWRDITGTSGATIADSPAAFYDAVTGHLDVYATGTDNHLWQATYASGWSWHDEGGSITGTPSPMHDAIYNTTEIYATGTEGALHEYAYSTSGGWSTSNLGGAISGSPSAMDDTVTGNLEVYTTGSGTSGNNVEETWYATGAGWHAFRDLGGSVTGSPSALVDRATGNPEVYATGTNGFLTSSAWTSSGGWTSWGTIGSGTTVTGSPAAIYDSVTSSLDLYALTGGAVSQISWKNSWGTWRNLGATPTFIAP